MIEQAYFEENKACTQNRTNIVLDLIKLIMKRVAANSIAGYLL
jgi:ribosomal protein S17E